MLVGVFHPSCIHPLHTVEVDQRAQHGFHRRAAPFGEETGVVFVFAEFLVHGIVERFVDAVFYLLELRDLAATFRSQRAVTTGALAAAVNVLRVTFAVGFGAFEEQQCMVSTGLLALVTVFGSVVEKPFSFGFVLSEVGDVGVDALLFAVL